MPPPRSLPPVPDLLSATPAVRVDFGALRDTLVFAFAMGGSVESFEEALGGASLPPSAWDRTHFARDLFLDDLVERASLRAAPAAASTGHGREVPSSAPSPGAPAGP